MSIGNTLLGLLESLPRHGYDLKRAFDEKSGHDRPLHYGQVHAPSASGNAIAEAGVTDSTRAGGCRMKRAGSLLSAHDLRKAYGPTNALDCAGFSIHPGEIVVRDGRSRDMERVV